MTFLVALVALGILLGTVSCTSFPAFLVAAGAIAAWLLVFTIRERLAHHRHR